VKGTRRWDRRIMIREVEKVRVSEKEARRKLDMTKRNIKDKLTP
jgi:hypothetical protein